MRYEVHSAFCAAQKNVTCVEKIFISVRSMKI